MGFGKVIHGELEAAIHETAYNPRYISSALAAAKALIDGVTATAPGEFS